MGVHLAVMVGTLKLLFNQCLSNTCLNAFSDQCSSEWYQHCMVVMGLIDNSTIQVALDMYIHQEVMWECTLLQW